MMEKGSEAEGMGTMLRSRRRDPKGYTERIVNVDHGKKWMEKQGGRKRTTEEVEM